MFIIIEYQQHKPRFFYQYLLRINCIIPPRLKKRSKITHRTTCTIFDIIFIPIDPLYIHFGYFPSNLFLFDLFIKKMVYPLSMPLSATFLLCINVMLPFHSRQIYLLNARNSIFVITYFWTINEF